MGGAIAPPAPPLATLLRATLYFWWLAGNLFLTYFLYILSFLLSNLLSSLVNQLLEKILFSFFLVGNVNSTK